MKEMQWNWLLGPESSLRASSKPVEHHGVVLVFKELALNNSYSFRIYLATNNSSDIKDIGKEVRCANKRYLKVEKPPTCKLDERRYRLMSEPEGDISPANSLNSSRQGLYKVWKTYHRDAGLC
ncbi:uncharacterized protein ACWYII_014707 [Salvelinus alpinus]